MLNNRINNNLYEDLLGKESQNEFLSLAKTQDKSEFGAKHPVYNASEIVNRVSKSYSLNNKNFYSHFNRKESNLLIDEINKNIWDKCLIRIKIIFIKIRKFSKLGTNLIQNEQENEKITNYKFRIILQIPKSLVIGLKSPNKKLININKEANNTNTNNSSSNNKHSNLNNSNSNNSGSKNLASRRSIANDADEEAFTSYRYKKNLKEIIHFNTMVLEKYQKKIEKKSKIVLELQTLNDELINYKQCFSEAKVVALNTIYMKMSQLYLFFVSEFLRFSQVDEETIDNVVSNFDSKPNSKKNNRKIHNNFNAETNSTPEYSSSFGLINVDSHHFYNEDYNKYCINNKLNSNLSRNKLARKLNSESSFFSEIEEKSFINDNSKIIDYINNTLLQKEYVFAEIKEIIYSQNKFEITVDLNLTTEKLNFHNYEANASIINSTENIEKSFLNQKRKNAFVSFNFKTLFSYLNNYSINYSKFGIIKNLLNLLNEVNEIVYLNGKKTFEKELAAMLNELLNDLFHIRSEVFYMFNLNKLLVLNFLI